MEDDVDMLDIEAMLAQEPKKIITNDKLDYYYKVLFPFSSFFDWLGKGNASYFERREITFTLERDIYCRYLCFSTPEEFRQNALKRLPHKIDIGAVYNTLVAF